MKIYKYTLYAGNNVVDMPQAAKILCVQKQGYDCCLWAEVDEQLPVVKRRFTAYGTGEEFVSEGTYIATVQLGMFVVHFYDCGEQ